MRALILIGGEGTRLRPLTLNTLKCATPIVNIPFYNYQFALLKKYGIKEVILSICHMPDKVKKIIGGCKKNKLKIIYVKEDKPLGTAGAIKNAEKYLTEDTIIMNGDVLTDIDLKKLIKFHKKSKAIATITLTEVLDPSAYGLVLTEKDRIVKFVEKPSWADIKDKWINAGIYVFNKKVLNFILSGRNVSLEREVFPELIKRNQNMMAYKSRSYWIDIGKIDKYKQVNFDLLEGRFKPDFLSFKKNIDIIVEKGTKFDKKASIRGPVVFGKNCKIGKGIYEPLVIVGNNCIIKDGAMIEKSIILDNVFIDEDVTIRNSIIGYGCKIQANSVLNEVVIGDNTIITKYSKLGHK